MASQLQNRIVGIVVLTALGVLFLPDLLNGEKASVEEHFATIPLRPSVATAVAPDEAFEPIPGDQPAEVDALVDDDLPQQAVVVDTRSEAPKAESAKPTAPSQSGPAVEQAGWAIRLGSFRDAGNVARLVTRLRDKGYRAYTIPGKPVNGELTVVYVGPEVSRDKLKTIQGRLAKDLGLQSQLVQYDPLQM